MEIEKLKIEGQDIPLDLLVPLRQRHVKLEKMRGFKRIVSSIKELGLIEPLCVYRENGKYMILDGFLRMKACEELGVKSVPCLIYPDKEAYTYNKMVNKLSPVQENRMLRNAMQTIDKGTVLKTLGIARLECRLTHRVIKALHPDVIAAIEKGRLSRISGAEFVHVVLAQQKEILQEMEKTNEFSPRFLRTMIIRTPEELRSGWKGRAAPWEQVRNQNKDIAKKLQEAKERSDFYKKTYHDYSMDLAKMNSFARQLITNEQVKMLLSIKHPDILERLQNIVFHDNQVVCNPAKPSTPQSVIGSK